MRQETITVTYLKFNELNDDQKKKVLDNLRNINVDHDEWNDFLIEDFKTKLESLGFIDIKVYWSGFWSQGDGASFTARHESGDITKSHMYQHSNTMHCEDKNLLELAKKEANLFYRDLEKNYNYLTSDAAVIESINANDYDFESNTLKIG